MQTEMTLKDGSKTQDARLDRLVHFDKRSLDYPAVPKLRGAEQRRLRSNTHNRRKFKKLLNQLRQGACVSFGIGHDLLAYPQERNIDDATCRRFYWDMQRRDPWQGGSYPGGSPVYEGTAVLTGLQVYKEYLESLDHRQKWEFRWCFGGNDVVTALQKRGVIIGVPWFEGMMDTDAQGFIHPTGRNMGGHCTYLDQSKLVWRKNVTHYEAKDLERELTRLRGPNSWGSGWGIEGNFYLTLADLDKLLAMDGEAAVLEPVR